MCNDVGAVLPQVEGVRPLLVFQDIAVGVQGDGRVGVADNRGHMFHRLPGPQPVGDVRITAGVGPERPHARFLAEPAQGPVDVVGVQKASEGRREDQTRVLPRPTGLFSFSQLRGLPALQNGRQVRPVDG